MVRINRSLNVDVIREKQDLTLSGYYTEPNFLSIFNFPLVKGSNTLQKPKTLLLTESTARKFFGDVDALGKTLELKGQGEFEVTGILQDLPKNTHFNFDALASYSSLPMHAQGNGTLQTDWTEYLDQYVYFRTRGAADAQAVQHALQQMEKQVYKTGDEVTASFHLQALSAINPGPDLRRGLGVVWDYVGLTVFGIVSLLILLPACFNYTNISIARALKRAKEIGMRKTMGSLNEHIFAQFITETVVITLISLLLAIGVFMLMRGEFLSMLAESSALDLSLTGLTLLGFVLFALLTGFVSGVAPALFFSRLNPIQALKNKTARGSLSGQKVRKALMVFQFAASFSFILLLVVFARQYRYTLNFNFGFQKENILDVALQDVNKQNFRTEFSRLPSVQDISMSSGVPGISVSRTYASEPERMDSLEVFQLFVDHRYIPNMKLSLLVGKNFTEADGVSEKSIIVNEEFLNVYKITSPIDALGRSFLVEGHDLTVIGIVKNFNFTSLREPIKSFFFRYNSNYFTHANIKVVFSDAYLGLSEMERTWQSIHGNKPFTAKFLDDEINDAYDFYSVMLKLLGYLGALALTISILGMLGMVVYTAESRTKEVGIRKVMGASSLGLTFLLSRDFIKLILLGALLATPLAVLVLDRLLMQAQYYSVTLSFWDVLLSLIILLTFGLLAIISQTLKTASTNPVDTLRVE